VCREILGDPLTQIGTADTVPGAIRTRGAGDGILYNDHEAGAIGPRLFEQACKMGLEGIVSKHRGLQSRPVCVLDQGQESEVARHASRGRRQLVTRHPENHLRKMRASGVRGLTKSAL
jgi:hypothetical protein